MYKTTRTLIPLIWLLMSGTSSYAQKKSLEVVSPPTSFNISEFVLFLDILDSDQKVHIPADVIIKDSETQKILFQESSDAAKIRMAVDKTYLIAIQKDKYRDTTFTLNFPQVQEYEIKQDVYLKPVRETFKIQVGDANTNREKLKVVVWNPKFNERYTLEPTDRNGQYIVPLRVGEEYELDVKDSRANFYYTEFITASQGGNNNVNIQSDKLKTLITQVQNLESLEDLDRAYSLKEDSLLDLIANLEEENERAKEENDNKAEQVIDSTRVAAIRDSLSEVLKDSLENALTSQEEIDPSSESGKSDTLSTAQLEEILIEKQREIQREIQTIKENIKKDPSLAGQYKNKILSLEDRLDKIDALYRALRNQNLQELNELKRDAKLIGNVQYVVVRYYKLLIALGIISALLLVGMGLFYWRARFRRRQRDEVIVLNKEIRSKNEEIKQQNEEIAAQRDNLIDLNTSLAEERAKSDDLLLNILPVSVADELKATGKAKMRSYKRSSILFTDFKGFSQVATKMLPDKLMEELNDCFSGFDEIIKRHKMEKIKTIGDAYMCAGGIPEANATNPVDAVLAGIEMQEFMQRRRKEKLLIGEEYWQCRLGINTGEIRAGVIGTSKFAYDIWGNAVNIASRMESGGEPNRVNISEDTYELVKDFFECEYRGEVEVKNGLILKMYFVNRIVPKLSADDRGVIPNDQFHTLKQQTFGAGVAS